MWRRRPGRGAQRGQDPGIAQRGTPRAPLPDLRESNNNTPFLSETSIVAVGEVEDSGGGLAPGSGARGRRVEVTTWRDPIEGIGARYGDCVVALGQRSRCR
jgi:hypothetical protein